MKDPVRVQEQFASSLDRSKFCSFDVEFNDNATFPLIHSAARFLYFIEGEGILTVNGIDYEICKDTLICIVPWDITVIKKVIKPLRYYKVVYNYETIINNLHLHYNPTNSFQNLFSTFALKPCVYCNDDNIFRFVDLFKQIKEEVGEESISDINFEVKELRDTYVISLIIQVLVLANRCVLHDSSKNVKDLQIDTINKIVKYIYSHLQDKITLEKLSKIFFMSESSISKILQDNIGMNFSEIINEMRINKSLDLLMYSDLSLNEVAEIVGYTDASHFLKAFTSKEGVTPNEYRKAYQNSHDILKKKERNVIFEVLNYIHDNYADFKIRAIYVAKRFNISVIELNRILMFQVEKNFDDYVDWLRISKACELLITTNSAITDIAIEVGYNTTKTFTRTFQNIRHLTPGVFRNSVSYQSQDGKIFIKEK